MRGGVSDPDLCKREGGLEGLPSAYPENRSKNSEGKGATKKLYPDDREELDKTRANVHYFSSI